MFCVTFHRFLDNNVSIPRYVPLLFRLFIRIENELISQIFKFVLANTVNETVVVFDFVGTECDSVKNENAI